MKKLFFAFLTVFLIVSGFWMLAQTYNAWVYTKKKIPTQIQIGRVLVDGNNINLIHFFLPIRMEACGGVAYEMMPETAEKIKKAGISFFHENMIGRDYTKRGKASYSVWQETTPNSKMLSEGMPLSLHCMFEDSIWTGSYPKEIFDALSNTGSYYGRTNTGAILYVFPDLKIVAYAYSH